LLSEYFDSEIISADSRQIFRSMDIGTDKVPLDIRQRIPHHQIDIVDPDEKYTAGQWQKDVVRIVDDIHQRKKLPVIV
jgi:tRNA dimethylallyltransferase